MAQPTDLQRLVRRAILIRAKADEDLTALVPAASINPAGEAAWPFILAEAPRGRQLVAACVAGAEVELDLHAYARAREEAGQVVETGYDFATQIGARLEVLFKRNVLTLEGGAKARVRLSDMNLFKDGTPDDWHWFGQLNARVLAA